MANKKTKINNNTEYNKYIKNYKANGNYKLNLGIHLANMAKVVANTGNIQVQRIQQAYYKSWDSKLYQKPIIVQNMEVTTFCPAGPNKAIEGGIEKSTGGILYWGVVAVDPKYFPYGTKFYIPVFDTNIWFIGADCGSAIKGNHIDLFFYTLPEFNKWGILGDPHMRVVAVKPQPKAKKKVKPPAYLTQPHLGKGQLIS